MGPKAAPSAFRLVFRYATVSCALRSPSPARGSALRRGAHQSWMVLPGRCLSVIGEEGGRNASATGSVVGCRSSDGHGWWWGGAAQSPPARRRRPTAPCGGGRHSAEAMHSRSVGPSLDPQAVDAAGAARGASRAERIRHYRGRDRTCWGRLRRAWPRCAERVGRRRLTLRAHPAPPLQNGANLLARSGQAGPDGAHTDVQTGGDVLVCQAIRDDHLNQVARCRRQRLDGLFSLMKGNAPDLGWRNRLVIVTQVAERAQLLAAALAEEDVLQDGHQPRLKIGPWAELVDVAQRALQAILDQVFRRRAFAGQSVGVTLQFGHAPHQAGFESGGHWTSPLVHDA